MSIERAASQGVTMNRMADTAWLSTERFSAPDPLRLNAARPDDDATSLAVLSGKPVNILLVDDEHMNLTVLETILDNPAYRLIKADSADQALLALLADEFALLILDIRMPGATGIELARMIKQRKKTADIPIIFLTAYYNEDQHVLEGYGAGAVDYLHKPVNADILRSKVSVFARLHRMKREIEASNAALRAEVAGRRRAQQQLSELNEILEQRVLARTRDLRASAALLQATTDNASVGLASVDLERTCSFANPAYCRMFGTGDDVVSKPLHEVLSTATAARIAPLLDRAFAGERKTCEISAASVSGDTDRSRFYSLIFEPERDADDNINGVVIVAFDITERKKTEEHVQLLLREVNHRAKNMLSVVSAIARQTKAPSQDEYVRRLSGRIQALAASHDLLSSKQWQDIAITELIRTQLSHFEALMGTRVMIDGPPVSLTATGAQFIGMVVHELATNAVKHGSLSNQVGRVMLSWDIERLPSTDRFKISWVETDGPPVVRPTQRGYGSTVIKNMAELSLEGRVTLDFPPSGLLWHLECPAMKILATDSTATMQT